MKKYITVQEEFDLEDIEAAKKRELRPLTSFEEGTRCIWFSLWREGKNKESQVVISKTFIWEHKRVIVEHVNKDGSLRQGGAVNKKELYEKINTNNIG